jgi:hypothetical protein
MMALPHDPADPKGFADLRDVEAWLAEDQHRRRAAFVLAVAEAPLDVLVDAIRTACLRGFGLWQEPPKPQPGRSPLRPATHLYEINLFGISGVGHDVTEAARSWRRAALNSLSEGMAA